MHRAVIVQGASEEILADSAFAGDEYVGRGIRHLPQDVELSKHLGTSRDDMVQSETMRQLAAQPDHFPAELAVLERSRNYQQ